MDYNVPMPLLSSADADAEIEAFHDDEISVISDSCAKTIASWYHSPAAMDKSITALSHGLTFNTVWLAANVETAEMYPKHYVAMVDWIAHIEEQQV